MEEKEDESCLKEEFAKLPWRITEPSMIDVGTNFLSEETVAQSFVFQNNFTPLSKFPDLILVQNNKQCSNAEKGQITKFFKQYPQVSRLNEIQHRQCLEALQLLENDRPLNFTQKEQQLINMYNNLKCTISEETVEFLKFVENVWKQKFAARTKNVPKKLNTFITERINKKIELIKNYPQFYGNHSMVPISRSENTVELIHECCLLELGDVAKLKVPDLEINNNMYVNKLPPKEEFSGILGTTKLSVSDDVHVEFLAKQTACNVVISSSSLKTIIDNFGPEFGATWDIPIIVKEHIVNGNKFNVVYIDKTFPERNGDHSYLKNFKIRKILLKRIMCYEHAHSFPTPNFILNNFTAQKNEPTPEQKELTDDETKDGDEQTPDRKKQKNKIVSHHNVNYRLWKLKFQDGNNVMMKNRAEKKEIKLLVRSKTDAFQIGANKECSAINLVPKLEYQIEHGATMLTRSELIRQWTTLYFRPFSNLLRVRLSPHTNKYVKIENVNLNKITNECLKHYNFIPKDTLGVLYNVLSNLVDLKPGKYILHHEPKHGPFAALMMSHSDSLPTSLNLEKLYDITTEPLQAKPSKWISIDTTLILPFHVKFGVLPGLFPPKFLVKNFGKPLTGNNAKRKFKNKKQKNKVMKVEEENQE